MYVAGKGKGWLSAFASKPFYSLVSSICTSCLWTEILAQGFDVKNTQTSFSHKFTILKVLRTSDMENIPMSRYVYIPY